MAGEIRLIKVPYCTRGGTGPASWRPGHYAWVRRANGVGCGGGKAGLGFGGGKDGVGVFG